MEVHHTTLGHLVHGSGVHAQDLVVYAAGVAVGALAEKIFSMNRDG
jgi:hypothetical protein